MMDNSLNLYQILMLIFSGFAAGFSKSSGMSLSSLLTPLMADAYGAKASAGIMLPILLLGSMQAYYYTYRKVNWRMFSSLFIPVAIGLFLAALSIRTLEEIEIKKIIALITLAMLLLTFLSASKKELFEKLSSHPLSTPIFGIAIAYSSLIANMGSPFLALFLLPKNLEKKTFVGHQVFFFFLLNLVKLPIAYHLGTVNATTIQLDLYCLLPMLVGGYFGIRFLENIPKERFRSLVQLLTALACMKLLLSF